MAGNKKLHDYVELLSGRSPKKVPFVDEGYYKEEDDFDYDKGADYGDDDDEG